MINHIFISNNLGLVIYQPMILNDSYMTIQGIKRRYTEHMMSDFLGDCLIPLFVD